MTRTSGLITPTPLERPAGHFFVRRRGGPTTPGGVGLLGELAAYARARRKWWLLGILALSGLVVLLSVGLAAYVVGAL